MYSLLVWCWNRNNLVFFLCTAYLYIRNEFAITFPVWYLSNSFFLILFSPQFSCVIFNFSLIVFQEAQKVPRTLCLSLWAVLNTWSSSRIWRWHEEKSNLYLRVLLCYTECSFPVLLCTFHYKTKWGSCTSWEDDTAMHHGTCWAASRDRLPQPCWESYGWWWKRCWGSVVREVTSVKCAFSERKPLYPI